jgi:hypothetical protein
MTPEDRIVRIEHAGMTSKLLGWILKVDHAQVRTMWTFEGRNLIMFWIG